MKVGASHSRFRTTGAVLTLGSLAFGVAAGMPLVDRSGRFIYSLPLLEQLQVIADKPQLWQWANIIFVAGDFASVAGLSLLALHLEEAGERISSRVGVLSAVLAAPLFAAFCSLRGAGGLWAADELVKSGSVPDAYGLLDRGADGLFLSYTVLRLISAALFSRSILQTGLLPRWAAWLALVLATAGAVVFVVSGDLPPFVHYIMPLLFGILLLVRRYTVTTLQLEQGSKSKDVRPHAPAS